MRPGENPRNDSHSTYRPRSGPSCFNEAGGKPPERPRESMGLYAATIASMRPGENPRNDGERGWRWLQLPPMLQ